MAVTARVAAGTVGPATVAGRAPVCRYRLGRSLHGWFVREPVRCRTQSDGEARRRRARRRRLAAALALGGWLVLLAAGIVGLTDGSGSEPGIVRASSRSTHVVAAGESLWDVAEATNEPGDPRATVAEIRRLNDLESADLEPGQVLVLP